MNEPLEELYFNWLCAKVMYDQPERTTNVLAILYKTEFVWKLIGDSNRADDGKELRDYFVNETHLSVSPEWRTFPCSVLEMMIGLAVRCEFETDIPVRDWFWTMMGHLNLEHYRYTPICPSDAPVIEAALYQMIWRTYDERGVGGLWPIIYPEQDQREVEIWYQFSAYLKDRQLL